LSKQHKLQSKDETSVASKEHLGQASSSFPFLTTGKPAASNTSHELQFLKKNFLSARWKMNTYDCNLQRRLKASPKTKHPQTASQLTENLSSYLRPAAPMPMPGGIF